MQSTVLTVSLLLMSAAAILFMRAVADSGPGEPDAAGGAGAQERRRDLIWALCAIGLVVSIVSLREWPHAIALDRDHVEVNVLGGQWWWSIDRDQVPLGEPVIFNVTTEDVTHGMGVYDEEMRLLFQTQAMPGYVNRVAYTFDRPGSYKVLCLEFCGVAHHAMTSEFEVVKGE